MFATTTSLVSSTRMTEKNSVSRSKQPTTATKPQPRNAAGVSGFLAALLRSLSASPA